MLVREWMSTNLITVDLNTPLMKALGTMKKHKIRRLPVLKNKELIGIVTDRDLKEASPSKGSSLNINDLYRLFSAINVKELMTKNPITVGPNESVETAAALMLENKISGLPVVKNKNLVGIITQTDIFKVITSLTGIYQRGIKIALDLPDTPGITRAVINTIGEYGGRIMSVMTSHDVPEEGHKYVFVRTKDVEGERLDRLLQELNKHFRILYTVKDVPYFKGGLL